MSFRPEYMFYLHGDRCSLELECMSDDDDSSIPSVDSLNESSIPSVDSLNESSISSIDSINSFSDSSDSHSTLETTESMETRSPSPQPHSSRRNFHAANWYHFIKDRPNDYLGLITFGNKKNPSGSARTEKFASRKKFDTFAWLLSTHRQFPKLSKTAEENLSCIDGGIDDIQTKYRNLKLTANSHVGVYRSKIHGRGLFSLVNISQGEMVIEFVGEVIRTVVLDKRDKYYGQKGIKSSFFKLDDDFVIDGTMKGNLSRFINHSCEPNCYPKVMEINGKRHLIIMSQSSIEAHHEITCDYELMWENNDITCNCETKGCRKILN